MKRAPVLRWILLASVVLAAQATPATRAATCVLWNRMESAANVLNSEIGPDGTVHGSSDAYEPAQFGNGYVRKAVGDYVSFPGSVLTGLTQRGTVEMWINPKVTAPQPYAYGIFGFVGACYEHYGVPSSDIALSWGDGVTGQGFMGNISFGGVVSANTPPEAAQFYATPGVHFHVAMCWDIAGIDGTADTIRVYRDGGVVGATSDAWDSSASPTRDITLGYGADSGGYDKFITDNIKLWDAALTDYSHRFDEAYPVPEPVTSLPVLGALGALGGYVRRRFAA